MFLDYDKYFHSVELLEFVLGVQSCSYSLVQDGN